MKERLIGREKGPLNIDLAPLCQSIIVNIFCYD